MAANRRQQAAPPAAPSWSDATHGGICFMGTYKFVWPRFSAANGDDMVVKLRDLLSESTLKDHYEEGLLAANFTSLDDLGKVKALHTSIQY